MIGLSMVRGAYTPTVCLLLVCITHHYSKYCMVG